MISRGDLEIDILQLQEMADKVVKVLDAGELDFRDLEYAISDLETSLNMLKKIKQQPALASGTNKS